MKTLKKKENALVERVKVKNFKVGIISHKLGTNSFGVQLPYIELFTRFDIEEIKFINPLNPIPDTTLDLLILTGGPDVETSRYGERPHLRTGKPDIFREWFDVNVLPKYIEAGIGIFGICRGHQTLAVHFGAKMIQDMYHPYSPDDKRWEETHSVCFNIEGITGIQKVNSIHHQLVASVPEHAEPIAWIDNAWVSKPKYHEYNSSSDLEALRYPNHRIASVQWHPEELQDCKISEALIAWLLYEH